MYEEFMQRHDKKEKSITIDFSNNIVVTSENIKQKFVNIDNMEEKEIYDLFFVHLDTILDSVFRLKDPDMIKLFTNASFIVPATKAARNITFSDIQKKRCNKLVYDYIVKRDKDETISNLLLSFSKAINKDVIPNLCGIGLSSEVATMIALFRYSSEKELLNMKRLNKVLMKESRHVMTEQMIVNIYCTLYTSALDMFEGVMYDISSYQNMNENAIEIYGTITLAVLDILDQLPLNIIGEVLRKFSENYYIQHIDDTLRFNIESFCPDDYPRIYSVMERLKENGVQFPRT